MDHSVQGQDYPGVVGTGREIGRATHVGRAIQVDHLTQVDHSTHGGHSTPGTGRGAEGDQDQSAPRREAAASPAA
ncbi:MAG TPA: hypothetical protein VFI25_09695 [Planctomycetota bacterium]|nr:hypothetical protein [Planctomycetota bacterium]